MAQGHGMGEQRLSAAHSAGAPSGGVSERAASSWSSSLGLLPLHKNPPGQLASEKVSGWTI